MIKKPDLAQAYTDAETLRIEKEMLKVYKDCEKDIKAKMTDFAQKHKVKDARYRQMVSDGKMSKEDYDAWKQGQVFTGQQWKAKREQIANSLYNANDAAHKIAQGHVSNVFAFNANYTNYKLEKDVNANLGFGLYNNASVARLLRDNPQLLPAKKLDKAKDVRWNMKNIKSELTKSIVQGESIDDLTERLSKEMPNRSFKQARVHARTMMTSAQNAGRLEAMYEHKAMGIQTMKVWLATLDERTRWMHRDLDGQERELDEYFEIGQYAIRFPADPLAAPAMVYNCRCTMEEKLKEYPDVGKMRRDNTVKPRDMSDENDGVIQYMTYNQWAEWKGVANERPNGMKPVEQEHGQTTSVQHMAFTAAKTIEEAELFARQFLQSQTYGTVSYKGIDLDCANKCNRVLNDVFNEYSPDYKLGKIAPMNGREKRFKSIIDSAEACYQWGGDGSLFINPKFYKDAKTLNKHMDEIESLMQVCLDGGQALLDSKRYTGARKTYIEALLKTKRQCVSQSYDFVEGTIIHESGHMLDDKLFRKIMRDIGSPLAKSSGLGESMAKYGGNISAYATTSQQEYIAESFTAWWHGETDRIDKELVRVFEEAKKYGK